MSAGDVIARAILDDADFEDAATIDLAEFPSCTRRAGVIVAALHAAGYAIVPMEPTEKMCEAGWIDKEDVLPSDIYGAMLAAADESDK